MILLALDSGFDRTGYSIFKKDSSIPEGYQYLTSGLIQTQKTAKLQDRILVVYSKLEKLLKTYMPTVCIMEQILFFKNQKSVIGVSQTQGAVMALMAKKHIAIEFLSPLVIKQSITGYGFSDKLAVQKMIQMTVKLPKKITQDDEADAIACGLAYCFINRILK